MPYVCDALCADFYCCKAHYNGGGDNWLIINTLHDLALRFMSLIVGLSVAKIQQNHVTAK